MVSKKDLDKIIFADIKYYYETYDGDAISVHRKRFTSFAHYDSKKGEWDISAIGPEYSKVISEHAEAFSKVAKENINRLLDTISKKSKKSKSKLVLGKDIKLQGSSEQLRKALDLINQEFELIYQLSEKYDRRKLKPLKKAIDSILDSVKKDKKIANIIKALKPVVDEARVKGEIESLKYTETNSSSKIEIDVANHIKFKIEKKTGKYTSAGMEGEIYYLEIPEELKEDAEDVVFWVKDAYKMITNNTK